MICKTCGQPIRELIDDKGTAEWVHDLTWHKIEPVDTVAPSQSVERERANLIRAITHNHFDKADWKAYDAALIRSRKE